jgi:hypothetical protein
MDEAFEGDISFGSGRWHSLLGNLDSVRDEDWRWLPVDGKRTIYEIVFHVGACKFVYGSHVSGDCSIHWDLPNSIPTIDWNAPPGHWLAYLREGQAYLRSRVEALTGDQELLLPRLTPQGWQREARWLIKTMIEHDIYHAGEINHLRALAQKDD